MHNTSVDAGASLGASLRKLASEAAAVCTASNEQRHGDSELNTIKCKARRGSDAYMICIYGDGSTSNVKRIMVLHVRALHDLND